MAIVQYLDDDTTPLAGYVFDPAPEAGETSAAVEVHAWNEGIATAYNVLIVQRTRSLTSPYPWLAVGLPPQDESMGRMRIVGYDNTGDATWSVANTDWVNAGAFNGLFVGDIPAGCAVYYEYAIHPSGLAAETGWTTAPIEIFNEYSQPTALAATKADRGVITGIGDATHNGLVSGLVATESGTPDDLVNISAGEWVHQGRLYNLGAGTHQLNQNDSAAAALAAGQSYYAAISVGAGVRTATKGTKGTTPTRPAAPAGDLVIAYALVQYGAGGSVIETADIELENEYDRYLPTDGGGLNLRIGKGQAIGGGTWRYHGDGQDLPLTDDDVNYVWQLASGLFDATLTDVYPEATALPHSVVTTAAGAITAIEDRRVFAGNDTVHGTNGAQWLRGSNSELITLSTGGATTDSTADLLPANAIIEAVVARVTTTITTATDWKLGDPTTAGRFTAANSTLVAGTTDVGLVHIDQTGAAGPRQTAAAKLRITTTGTPGAGAVRATVFYRQFVPPSS